MARMLVLDVNDCKVYEKDCNCLQDYYSAIRCNTIDIVSRQIGGRYFDIIVDDEGFLKPEDEIYVSAINSEKHVMLVGTLVFANHDSDGNETDLTDQDVEHIRNYIKCAFLKEGGVQPILTECDF